MNYPVWYIPHVGGPLLIAFVAIIHVIVSHFAVGGGLWLVLTEKKGYEEKKKFVIEYVKKHTLFFMLLTMVFGAITGVGIWFTISLIHPGATSTLIHSFVFGWAIEWVLFVVEIVAAFLYFYTFGKISEKTHLMIGWIYFAAAWGSLLIINAILSFMLTPGKWIETGNFWDGIFNPTYFSSTVFRTFLCLALAGSYALLTASRKYSGSEREYLVRYNGKWIMISLAGMIPSLIWYYFSLPEFVKEGISGASNIMKSSAVHLYISLAVFILLLFIFALWKAKKLNFPVSVVILVSIFIFFGAFEFIREAGRKPYIISGYMYSNEIKVGDSPRLKESSILENAKWSKIKEINLENIKEAGGDIFRIECYSCHSLGIKNNIMGKISGWDKKKIERIIGGLRGITKFMPAFHGTDLEKKALALWLYEKSGGKFTRKTQALSTLDGSKVYTEYCADCHEIDGENAMRPKIKKFHSLEEIIETIGKLNQLNEDMPEFEGSEEEKKALAEYLLKLRSEK